MSCQEILAAVLAVNADTRLTATEKVIFTNIAGGYQKRAEIAKASGCAESSVPRAVRKLESFGLLLRKQEPGKANAYIITKPATGIGGDTPVSRGAIEDGVATGIKADTPPHADTGISQDTHDILCRASETKPKMRGGAPVATPVSIPPKDNNQTPPEFYPEPPELVVMVAANSDRPPPPAWQRVLDAVRSPYLDENKSQRLILEGYEVEAWLRAGADEHLDVIPTVRRLIERKRESVPWSYFTKAVREAAAKRKAAEQFEIITPAEAKSHDSTSSTSVDGVRVRRESVSPATAARLQRRARREAERQPIDFGRVDSERLD